MKFETDFDLLKVVYIHEAPLSLQRTVKIYGPLMLKQTIFLSILFSILIENPKVSIIGSTFGTWIGGTTVITAFLHFLYQKTGDLEQEAAKKELIEFVKKLNHLDINTNLELLLKTEQDDKTEYEIYLNENKLPVLMQRKYLLIPSYTSDGEIKDTGVIQEHVMFSKKYSFSKGTKSKSLNLVPKTV